MPVDESTIMQRRNHLYNVLANVDRVHREWVDSDVGHITQDYETAIEELIAVFGEGDMPGDLRAIAAVVTGDLQRYWLKWRDEASGTQELVLPGDAFWKALENAQKLTEAAKEPPRVSLEPIEELYQQKVSEQQICLIYGFQDARGNPDFQKLRDERKNPGKHTGEGTGWLPPIEKARRASAAAAERSRARLNKQVARKAAAAPKPAESIELLVSQGVSAQQIASMHGLTIEEVFEQCDKAGIDRPSESYDIRRGVHDRDVSEAEERQLDAMDRQVDKQQSKFTGDVEEPAADGTDGERTIEEEILFYAKQGMDPAAIRGAIGAENVSKHKITTVLKAAEAKAK